MMNTMSWLNSLAGNFASYMKNYTPNTYYGILVNGCQFITYPESNMMGMSAGVNGSIGGIQVSVHDVEMLDIKTLQQKWYKAPIKGYPAYIEELNCVLFASEEEREDRIKAYGGSASKLVKAYASGLASLINASFTAITVLNTDKQFYVLNNGSITRLPAANDEQRLETLKKYALEEDLLNVKDVFIINTVIRNTRASEGESNEVTVSSDIKIIPKNEVIFGEPIISDCSGIVVFEGRDSAEEFVNKYGTLTKYLVSKALSATHEQYETDLADVNDQASKDKNAMMTTFMVMGGTTLVSSLSDNLIKSVNDAEDDKTAITKALKVMGIGLGAVLVGVGLYKTAKYLKLFGDKKKEDK